MAQVGSKGKEAMHVETSSPSAAKADKGTHEETSSPSAAAEPKMKKHVRSKADKDQQTLECRSNLSRLSNICKDKDITDGTKKKEILKELDIYSLIRKPINKKNNLVLFEALVDVYDTKTEAFIIQGRHMKLCDEEVAYLTRLPCEGNIYAEKRVTTLPTYFVNLCKTYGKFVEAGKPVSLKLMTDLINEMHISSEDDRKDFTRLVNSMTCYVLAVKTQGKIPLGCMGVGAALEKFSSINWPKTICNRIHNCMKERKVSKEKTHVTCSVQVLDAWFNMRTGRMKSKGRVGNEEEVQAAPLLSYLGVLLRSDDVENVFQQIDRDEIISCRNPRCSIEERHLDSRVQFSYKCSTYALSIVVEDFMRSYLIEVLNKNMINLGIRDDAGELLLNLTKEFHATDNYNLWQALCSKGDEIRQGYALEGEKSQNVSDVGMKNQNEDEHEDETSMISGDMTVAAVEKTQDETDKSMKNQNEDEHEDETSKVSGDMTVAAVEKTQDERDKSMINPSADEEEALNKTGGKITAALKEKTQNEDERVTTTTVEKTRDEAVTSTIIQDVGEDKALMTTIEKITDVANLKESPLNVDTENRDISSGTVLQTEARPDKKSVKFSDDVEDVLKKTCKLATAVPKLKKKQRKSCVDYGNELVKKRIEVWWPMDNKFYAGIVKSFDSETKTHEILYDDTDIEHLVMRNQKFNLLSDDGKAKNLVMRTEGKSEVTTLRKRKVNTQKKELHAASKKKKGTE